MSVVKRTSISISSDVLKKGLARVRELDYGSFSEYLAFLIERDASERPQHVLVRGQGGTKAVFTQTHEPAPEEQHGADTQPKRRTDRAA